MEEFSILVKNKKNVYMAQINNEYVGSVYLPYAIGSIAAFAWQNPTVIKNYNLKPFFYLRKNMIESVDSLDDPALVAFSGYIWNFELCKWCAQKIKANYPDCIIVFGGHSTPESEDFLNKNSYIDYLVIGEGEEPFTELLCALTNDKNLNDVSNILYRDAQGNAVKSKQRDITATDYPSPYLEGYFDKIIQKETEVDFYVIIETNRGCPYKCTYCDWGYHHNQVRCFPLKRIYAEIDWIAARKIKYLYCADANFGILSRDRRIVDKIIQVKTRTGYPDKFHVNYTKNSNQTVFEINKDLNKHGMSKGATLSFQSLSPIVLRNIRRTNMSYKRFSELMSLYNSNNIMTYSELILGLPGETYESFKTALGRLLEAGQHSSIIILNCYWLVNSEMGKPEYVEQHRIETVPAPIHQTHSLLPEKGSIVEYSPLVVSTATMSREMWVKTELLSFCVLCFHCFGLFQYFAIYLFNDHNIKYEVFYERLFHWLEANPHTVCGKVFSAIHKELVKASQGNGLWFYNNSLFGKITWPFEEGMFLEIAYNSEQFYEEVTGFLKQFNIDSPLFEELLSYQKNMLKLPGRTNFEFEYGYDFYQYFSKIYAGHKPDLFKRKNVIRITDRNVPGNWEQYAVEVVWYGRRGGKCLHTGIEQFYC